jgi:hypothetical protein
MPNKLAFLLPEGDLSKSNRWWGAAEAYSMTQGCYAKLEKLVSGDDEWEIIAEIES